MAKRKAKKKNPSPPSHQPPPPAIEVPPLANIPIPPVVTAPPYLSILGKGPLAPIGVEPPSPHPSSAESSCAEDSEDGESSSYADSSSSGEASDSELMSAPPSPLLQLELGPMQIPVQGLSPPTSAPNPVDNAALGSVQPTDPMLAEVDVAAGGWEQVRKKHHSNKHSRKKLSRATTDVSAGLVSWQKKVSQLQI
ncbi:hypothetical protein OIU78_002512 [Salix suchowensis]|nr:hypothetical protein OIU78_002512 [Salix suchowensis]